MELLPHLFWAQSDTHEHFYQRKWSLHRMAEFLNNYGWILLKDFTKEIWRYWLILTFQVPNIKCPHISGNVHIFPEMSIYFRKCSHISGNVRNVNIFPEIFTYFMSTYFRKCLHISGNVHIFPEMSTYFRKCPHISGNMWRYFEKFPEISGNLNFISGNNDDFWKLYHQLFPEISGKHLFCMPSRLSPLCTVTVFWEFALKFPQIFWKFPFRASPNGFLQKLKWDIFIWHHKQTTMENTYVFFLICGLCPISTIFDRSLTVNYVKFRPSLRL